MLMLRILKCLLVVLITAPGLFLSAQDTTQKIVAGRTNSASVITKPYLLIVSIDGFRHDYATRFNARNLLKFSEQGVRGAGIRPAFPSLTFPNHYTLATGMYPAHHGLVDNYFYDKAKKTGYAANRPNTIRDSSWYNGIPFWVLAEQSGMLAACFYWVGSEAAIRGVRPTYNYNYNTSITAPTRVDIVQNWLNLPDSTRPHLISMYFSEVDNAAHVYGADAPQVGKAVQYIDSIIGLLASAVAETGVNVNFIVLSDHGMTTVDNENPMRLPAEIDTSKFIVPRGDALLQVYAKQHGDIMPLYRILRKTAVGYTPYLKRNLPRRWKYGGKNDRFNRVGDIVLVARAPKVFNTNYSVVDRGKHGFDPAMDDMLAGFFAWGPAFKKGITINRFENIHIYPLVAHLLDLQYNHPIDGRLKVLKGILAIN
ncbi:MAG: alkaline phosphatase family protein [Chitinophagaceae bacterium]|nr:MAG: alkaline phosphatase family protein [Chitinophagaceae bacterium]